MVLLPTSSFIDLSSACCGNGTAPGIIISPRSNFCRNHASPSASVTFGHFFLIIAEEAVVVAKVPLVVVLSSNCFSLSPSKSLSTKSFSFSIVCCCCTSNNPCSTSNPFPTHNLYRSIASETRLDRANTVPISL